MVEQLAYNETVDGSSPSLFKKILCKKLKSFGEKIAQWSRVLACRAKGRGFKSRFSLIKTRSVSYFL